MKTRQSTMFHLATAYGTPHAAIDDDLPASFLFKLEASNPLFSIGGYTDLNVARADWDALIERLSKL